MMTKKGKDLLFLSYCNGQCNKQTNKQTNKKEFAGAFRNI